MSDTKEKNSMFSILDIYRKPTLGPDPIFEKLWATNGSFIKGLQHNMSPGWKYAPILSETHPFGIQVCPNQALWTPDFWVVCLMVCSPTQGCSLKQVRCASCLLFSLMSEKNQNTVKLMIPCRTEAFVHSRFVLQVCGQQWRLIVEFFMVFSGFLFYLCAGPKSGKD